MKFDMGQAWSEAVAMMTANKEVLGIVAGIFFFLPSLASALLGPDLNAMMNITTPEQFEQFGAQLASIYTDYWWLFTVVTIAQMIGYLSLLALLRDDAQPTVGDAIRTGVSGLLPAIGAYILFAIGLSLAVGVLIGLAAASGLQALAVIAAFLFVPVIFYLCIKVSLAAPVIAIDKVFNPITVLVRSWKLTKGNSFRLFAFILLIGIAYVVISSVVGIVMLGLVSALGDDGGRIVQGVFGGLLGTIATVVMVSVLAAIHRQLSGPSAGAVSETFE